MIARYPDEIINEATSMGKLPVFPEDIIVTSQLPLRPARSPNRRAEIQTIKILLNAISETPELFWQKLAESALQLCRAGTAGISVLDTEDGAEVFKEQAVAGVLSGRLNRTMPHASPCGLALDRGGPQLISLPERLFSNLTFDPPIVEALIIPFRVKSEPAGTVWLLAHDDSCMFSSEDERIGRTLASFAAAGWYLWIGRRNAEAATERDQGSTLHRIEPLKAETIDEAYMHQELKQLTQRLETRAAETTAELIATGAANATTVQDEVGEFNALLTVIQGYTTLMKADLADPTKLQEDLEAITEATSLVQSLISSKRRGT